MPPAVRGSDTLRGMESSAAAAPPDPADPPPAPPAPEPAAPGSEPSSSTSTETPLPSFRPRFGQRFVVTPFWAGLLGGGVLVWIFALAISFKRAGVIEELDELSAFGVAFASAVGIALWRGYHGPVRSYAALFGRIVGAIFFGGVTVALWLALLIAVFDAADVSKRTGFFVISLGGALFAALALLRLHGIGASRPRRIGIAAGVSAVLLVSTYSYSAALRCRLGAGEWCATAAEERADRGDHRAAAEYGARGCDDDDALSCTMAGIEYQRGQGIPRDLAQAERFFRRGCALGDEGGCGRVHGIELSKRCGRAGAFACWELAEAYAHGRDVDQDRESAAHYYRKACLLGEATACGR